MNEARRKSLHTVDRVVVKIGSSLLTGASAQGIRLGFLRSMARQLKALSDRGITPIVVSSGAIAAGLSEMGWTHKPKEIPKLQALAAIGQCSLMQAYETTFRKSELKVAQILVTREDLSNKARYLNAHNTLNELLGSGVVPIINENDTVAVDEIKFGDNDTLSVLVTHVAQAGCLVILTDIDGVYDRDPRKDSSAKLVHDVMGWDPALESAAGDSKSLVGTGGMASKVRAAKRMWQSGLPMAILSGETVNGLVKLFDGETIGTFFHPAGHGMHAQERWLAWGALPKGTVVVDEGAHRALVQRKTSLLPSGVKGVKGHWETGDVIRILDLEGHEVARGVSGYSSQETDRVKGLKSSEISALLARKDVGELVHRDHMVIMEDL
jgi:glutamate 5-kinase